MPPRPPAPTAQTGQINAPTGGLNTAAAGLALPPTDCVQAYNLVAAENGLRVRYGSAEHVVALTGAADNEVRHLMPFIGSSTSRAFATTSLGLWDVTSSTDAPAISLVFTSSTGNAGYGVHCPVVVAGGHYLLYADEVNGLYSFPESGGSWSKVPAGTSPGELAGVDPADVVFPVVFAGRLWFVERDTASAWYLPAGQVFGTAVEFPMGMKFAHGGTLVGLWVWSYDGGSGMASALVAISSGGDVLIWQGTDPASADTFSLKGVWYMGPPPAGRQIASSFGGELLLITRQGVLPLSRLVVGIPDVRAESLTVKVANLVNSLMQERAAFQGWQLIQHPEDNALLLLVPQGTSDAEVQLVQAVSSKGWFLHRGLLMKCAMVFDKALYFGTPDGRVLKNTGYLDGVLLSDPNAYEPVHWNLLTAFSDLGNPVQKQVGLIRPLFISDGGTPSYEAQARYRYSQEEIAPVALVSGGSGTWDTAVWDTDVWGGSSNPAQSVRGAYGMGTAVAVALAGAAIGRTILVSIDVTYTAGGFL